MFRIVKASAGSGKTHALTGLYLSLLRRALQERPAAGCRRALDHGEGYGWPEILAVTFTNKAAAEMKERVVRSLKARALGLPGPNPAADWPQDQAAAWLDVLIRRLGALNIRTIDSLLYLLVRLSALELDLPPDFEPLFDEAALVDPLFDAVAARAAAGNEPERSALDRAGETVLYLGGAKGFRPGPVFRERLTKVFFFLLHNDQELAADGQGLETRAADLYEEMRHEARRLLEILAALDASASKNTLNALEKCLACATFADPPTSAMLEKPDLAECVLKKDRDKLTAEAREAYRRLCSVHAACGRRGKLLVKAAELAPFVDLARFMLDELRDYQRRHAKVPHSLWTRYARQLLGEGCDVSDAFCRMGSRLSHLLVDEFQDTSRDQWEAMAPLAQEALSKGGTLFCVGDVKQAIYGWRGGDASLFEDIAHDPELRAVARELEAETLPNNWRSSPTVVEFNNAVFAGLGDPDAAAALARAMLPKAPVEAVAALAEAVAGAFRDAAQQLPDTGQKGRPAGLVRLVNLRAAKKEELQEVVAEELRNALFNDILPRRRPGDVAVLVRKNDDAELLSQLLIDWGLPVISENSLLLAEHPIVRQIIALLTFLDYPLNDVAFWEFITGPELFLTVSGLDEQDLDDWLVAERRGPLYQSFRDYRPQAWQRWIEPLYSQAGLMSPYDMVREIVGRYRVLRNHPEHELFVRRFLESVHAAEEQGCQSLSTFLEMWNDKGGEQKVPLPESVEAIRVMTVHKAKGLEFPVVLVPFHNFGGPRTGDLTAVTLPGRDDADLPAGPPEPGAPAILAPREQRLGPFYFQTAIPELCESLHLLYVAWTRPVEELHCFITATDSHKTPITEALGVLLADYGLDQPGDAWEAGQRPPAAQAAPCPEPPAEAPPEPAPEPTPGIEPEPEQPGRPMAWLPRLKIFRNALDEADFDQRRRGILAHRCLENLQHTGHDRVDIERAVHLAMAAEPGLSAEENTEELAAELRDVLHWATGREDLAELLRSGRPEQAILDEQGRVSRVDRMIDTDQATVVLEYKTGGAAPEHREQVRHYLDLLRRLPGRPEAKPLKGLLVYLDERRVEEVVLQPGEA